MDTMIRGTAFGSEVRFLAAYSKDTVEEARRIHGTTPVCTAALGRLLTAGAMMGALYKNDGDLLTLKVDGSGPIRQLTVSADTAGHVRGLMYDPLVELPLKENGHLDVGGAIGAGTLTVIRDQGLKEPYSGTTPLVSGELGDDITYYFAASEQTPSSVGLGVLVDRDLSVAHAAGLIIQLLPHASEATLDALEEALSKVRSVTDYFTREASPEYMMCEILGDIKKEESIELSYKCTCDRDRVVKALLSLGRSELESLIAENRPVTLHCDFCNKDYPFEIDEIKEML